MNDLTQNKRLGVSALELAIGCSRQDALIASMDSGRPSGRKCNGSTGGSPGH
jgi:hypothetical protein